MNTQQNTRPEDDRERGDKRAGEHAEPAEGTETVSTQHSPEHSDAPGDVESDPALDDRLGSDWIDEGGATSVGPATSAPGGVETEASKRQVRIDREREEREAAEREGERMPSRERTAPEPG